MDWPFPTFGTCSETCQRKRENRKLRIDFEPYFLSTQQRWPVARTCFEILALPFFFSLFLKSCNEATKTKHVETNVFRQLLHQTVLYALCCQRSNGSGVHRRNLVRPDMVGTSGERPFRSCKGRNPSVRYCSVARSRTEPSAPGISS